ncbi:MAG: hypothetical protein DME51_08825 [Verrucomicrobia bacterium]|nr:MAG: hypothetical protein DME51_08825 [Verrucomicrobiota bacterium]
MKTPYGETIRGEVSSRKIYGAGGLSYFSSGVLVCGSHVGACPEAVPSTTVETRQINNLAVKTLK